MGRLSQLDSTGYRGHGRANLASLRRSLPASRSHKAPSLDQAMLIRVP